MLSFRGPSLFPSPAVLIVVVFHGAVAPPYCACSEDAACCVVKEPEQF